MCFASRLSNRSVYYHLCLSRSGVDGQYGSLDSLSTAVSFSSHADRCLLKSYGSLDNLRPTDTATDQDTAAIKQRKGHYQLLEATCSEREELASGEEDAAREEADRELKEKAVQAVLDKVGFTERGMCFFSVCAVD